MHFFSVMMHHINALFLSDNLHCLGPGIHISLREEHYIMSPVENFSYYTVAQHVVVAPQSLILRRNSALVHSTARLYWQWAWGRSGFRIVD